VRGALITKGGPAVPDLAVQRREGISHFAWESDDPVFDTSMALWAHQKGLQVVTQFGPAGSPELTAKFASDEITRLGGGLPGHTPQAQLDVMPDQETSHDPAWFVAFYKAFRKLRTARIVYATLEWHQAGWFSQEMKDEINTGSSVKRCARRSTGSRTRVEVDRVERRRQRCAARETQATGGRVTWTAEIKRWDEDEAEIRVDVDFLRTGPGVALRAALTEKAGHPSPKILERDRPAGKAA
jgi:hypothetical protein